MTTTALPLVPPPSIAAFSRAVLPLLHANVRAQRMLDSIASILQTDRWNSFSQFHQTTKYLQSAYEAAGAAVEVHHAPTGGYFGTGRWIVQEAHDIHHGILDIVSPIYHRVLDYRNCPWHVAQFSSSTPTGGLDGDLIVIDTPEALEARRSGSLAGKVVLTKLNVPQYRVKFYDRGASAVVSDVGVADLPDAVQWVKLGWGGFDLATAAARIVCLAISPNQGQNLRRLHQQHKTLRVHVECDVQRYCGTHDVVSGIVQGRDDPTSEVWAVAHSAEPGALDNGSGVACCIEIAAMLNDLISTGRLPRPRRSIRLLHGYECYGFFNQLEFVRRFEPPLAGVCIDTLGAKPEVCQGHLRWHASVPSSASFAEDLGEVFLRDALAIDDAGYQYESRPFLSTDDTLMGDPHYGFPMPWITNHPFTGYHSSADTLEMVSPRGLAVCTAAMASYLYYLADAGTEQALEMAQWQTRRLAEKLAAAPRTSAQAQALRIQHDASMQRLGRLVWSGRRQVLLDAFAQLQTQADSAVAAAATLPTPPLGTPPPDSPILAAEIAATLAKIPIRRRTLAPTTENVFPALVDKISSAQKWAHYWADGMRTVEQIGQLMGAALNRTFRADAMASFFQGMAELGYLDLVAPQDMLTEQGLLADLRALGVHEGMDLMVHSSLSKIGPVRGGAPAVITALLKAIGSTGTLLTPSFNFSLTGTYNPLTTPTCNGAIADALWRRPDALRSDHPSHPVAAIGPKAQSYLSDHAANGIWAANSPIGRLVHGGGWVMVIGDVNEPRTVYHIAEISLNAPCLDQFGIPHRVVQADGSIKQIPGLAWRNAGCPVEPKLLDPALDQAKLQTRGKIGRAVSTLARAIDVYNMRRTHLGTACSTCPIRPGYCK